MGFNMNKKILIVNSKSIYTNNATGITLRSLFENYDKSQILEIFWEEKPSEINMQYIFLKNKKYSIAYFLMKCRKGKMNNVLKKQTLSNNKQSIFKKIFSFIRQFIVLIPDMSKIVISNKDFKRILDFNPDVIYTLGGGINALKVSYELSLRYNIPIIIHHMDNWMHSIQWENNPLLYMYKNKLRKYCKKCYTRTNISLAISDEMAKVYTKEYKINHLPLMNSIDVATFKCREDTINSTPFKFIYAGGLHLERYKSLIDIGLVIDKLNKVNKTKAKLLIYTGIDNIKMYKTELEKCKCIDLHEAIPHENIKEVYENANVLIHVESSTLEKNDFFKYSISTKIPEYLSTERPILFYGPDSIYLYRFLNENDIAYTANNKYQLEFIINKMLMMDKKTLNMVAKNGYEFALRKFDLKKSIEIFSTVLNEAEL